MKPKFYLSLLAAAALLWADFAGANKPPDITEVEMTLLPRYCRDAQSFGYGDAYSNTSPRAASWVALMGKSFWHIHHYCWALINIRRAQQPLAPKDRKRAQLEDAMGDLKYVISNSPSDFVLLPEIYTWMGRVQVQLRQPEALEAFARARAQKPDYWPPYFHAAEFLKAQGHKDEAMKIVRAGLERVPKAKALLMLYGDLGGKPGDLPTPLTKPAPVTVTEEEEQRGRPAAQPSSDKDGDGASDRPGQSGLDSSRATAKRQTAP